MRRARAGPDAWRSALSSDVWCCSGAEGEADQTKHHKPLPLDCADSVVVGLCRDALLGCRELNLEADSGFARHKSRAPAA